MIKKFSTATDKKPVVKYNRYIGMDSETFKTKKDVDELDKMIEKRKKKLRDKSV